MQLHTTIAQVSKINTEIKNLVFLNIFTHYPALPYITLYYPTKYPTLPFITLYYPSYPLLPCITLYYPSLPYITLYYLALPFINPALPFKFHDIFINFVRSLLTD